MNFWSEVAEALKRAEKICLLYVIESEGSSPGRQGFKMFVSSKGAMQGSIGGGFMEHKLVELAKTLILKKETAPFIKRQIHKKDIGKNKSGMICSGEQTIAFYFLNESNLPLINHIKNASGGSLKLNETGLYFENSNGTSIACKITNEKNWGYTEPLNQHDTIYIVGGGHVSLALSQTMHQLGFHVVVIDNRENLHTMKLNNFAHQKLVINYEEAEKYIPEGNNIYVALVSFGYVTDSIVLRKIIRNKYRYLGMMGSVEKVNELFKEMLNDGFTQAELDKVHSPIGIAINSKTTEEIAISIAAEIIQHKNKRS